MVLTGTARTTSEAANRRPWSGVSRRSASGPSSSRSIRITVPSPTGTVTASTPQHGHASHAPGVHQQLQLTARQHHEAAQTKYRRSRATGKAGYALVEGVVGPWTGGISAWSRGWGCGSRIRRSARPARGDARRGIPQRRPTRGDTARAGFLAAPGTDDTLAGPRRSRGSGSGW